MVVVVVVVVVTWEVVGDDVVMEASPLDPVGTLVHAYGASPPQIPQ